MPPNDVDPAQLPIPPHRVPLPPDSEIMECTYCATKNPIRNDYCKKCFKPLIHPGR